MASKYIPIRPPFKVTTPDGKEIEFTTRQLLLMVMSYIPPGVPGLSGPEVLTLETFRDRCNEAETAGAADIKLGDLEYNALKPRMEIMRWPVFGSEVALFIRDVRDAKDKPSKATKPAAALTADSAA